MSIFYGGSIITINNNQPLVDAVGIEGDKIVATGSLEEVKKKNGERCEINRFRRKFTSSRIY